MTAKRPRKVYVSKTVDVEAHAEIDVIAELEEMDDDDVRALHAACAERVKLPPPEYEDDEIGIDIARGRRELAALIDRQWANLTHHAQFVARRIGV